MDFASRLSGKRNPTIADLLNKIEYIEKMGTGISKIRRLISEAGLKPPKYEFGTFFTITFPRPTVISEGVEKGVEKGGQKLTAKQIALINLLKQNPMISRKDIAEKMGINESAVQKRVNSLRKKGVIRRIGPDKGGHWEIRK